MPELILPQIPRSPMFIGDGMSQEWQDFFLNLYVRVGELEAPSNSEINTIINPITELSPSLITATDSDGTFVSVSNLAAWVIGIANEIVTTNGGNGTVNVGISDFYLINNIFGETDRISVTDNLDGTITLNVSDTLFSNLISGTTNRVTVSDNGDGTVTLSTPQDSHVNADVTYDSLILNDLDANKPVFTDASRKLTTSGSSGAGSFLTPTVQVVTAGTLTSGTVTDVQGWSDGNQVNITEVAATPGFDVRYGIPNVADFSDIQVSFYYDGSTTHECKVQIYNNTTTTWKDMMTQSGSGLSHNTRFISFPVDSADYISLSNQVVIRFYHPQGGNAVHQLYIDYVSIIGNNV